MKRAVVGATVAVAVTLVVAAVAVGRWWVRSSREGERLHNEGVAWAQTEHVNQNGCVAKALQDYDGAEGIAFVTACIQNTSDNELCKHVPRRGRDPLWPRNTCVRLGEQTRVCEKMMERVAELCRQSGRAKK